MKVHIFATPTGEFIETIPEEELEKWMKEHAEAHLFFYDNISQAAMRNLLSALTTRRIQ